MSEKSEKFLTDRGWDKNNPAIGGAFFKGVAELLDDYEQANEAYCVVERFKYPIPDFHCDEYNNGKEACLGQCIECKWCGLSTKPKQ